MTKISTTDFGDMLLATILGKWVGGGRNRFSEILELDSAILLGTGQQR